MSRCMNCKIPSWITTFKTTARSAMCVSLLLLQPDVSHAEAVVKERKVLVIGIDGCRPDALRKATAPELAGLAEKGAFSYTTQNLPLRLVDVETSSGPGWASMLCGAFPDKHGWLDDVRRRRFNGNNPHFFARLKAHNEKLKTASIIVWRPIMNMVTAADVNESFVDDKGVEDRALDVLGTLNPDAMFIHLDAVDHAGHHSGFSAENPEYLGAIEAVDGRVGRIIAAIRKRPTFVKEDWLFIVSSDHGGWGNGHNSHRNVVPDIRRVFLIVSGDTAMRGEIEGQTYIIDVAATALVHMGVKLDPAWNLDGIPAGLKGFPSPAVSRPNEPAATELIRVKK